MNYRQRLEKSLLLPSGVTVRIQKLNAFATPFLEKRVSDDSSDHGARLSRYILTNKVGPVEGLKIVETVQNPNTEIGIDELEQPDIDAIVAEVLEFSGLTKRGEEARKTFPEAEAERDQRSQAGQAVRLHPDGTPEATTGRVAVVA